MNGEVQEMLGISNDPTVVEDCEHVAQMASKYGYDILCEDGTEEMPEETVAPLQKQEEDPNCDKAIKRLSKFGYEVVCE